MKTSMDSAFERVLSRWFGFATCHPYWILVSGLVLLMVLGAGLRFLQKDVSVEAFIPPDHPSIAVRDHAEELFGLRDPIVVAMMAQTADGIYRPEALRSLGSLHAQIAALPNVNSGRVMSLASESSIAGVGDQINIDRYFDEAPLTQALALQVKQRIAAMPPHLGTLVSNDGSAAMIVAELFDDELAEQTYLEILALVGALQNSALSFHVAGQGAVGGHLSGYIDQDYKRLQPLVFTTILLMLFLAFRRFRALVPPLLVIAGATAGALGAMGWLGVSYYPITSALPIVLVGISVADAIHVLTRFYDLRERYGERSTRTLVVLSMVDMWRPVTLTTVTTAAGFVGIAMASIMPPISYFGWFATLGVVLAWLYTMSVVPAVMVLLDPGRSPAFRAPHGRGDGRKMSSWLTQLAIISARRPWLVLTTFSAITILLVGAAQSLDIDRSQIENFLPEEPIYRAHHQINQRFAGTSYLDVVVETDQAEGLLDTRRMNKLVALQEFMLTLPHLNQTSAIGDYLQLLHQALDGEYTLPQEEDAISQYLLVYEASGDPTDLEEEIDSQYQAALVRGYMNTSAFSQERHTVEALDKYVREQFNEPGMSGRLSGRVNVDYHWMSRLGDSHFHSIAISLVLALLAAVVLFRSIPAGGLAMIPVCFAILCVYGVMGLNNIDLEPATSMFAAISVGLGIDFAIHLVTRIRQGLRDDGLTLAGAIETYFPTAARACCFSLAALGLGFGVLLMSQLVTLQRFGGLVAVASISSFLAALLIVPAVYAVALNRRPLGQRKSSSATASLTGLIVLLSAAWTETTQANDAAALQVATNIFNRPTGLQTRSSLSMELIDRRGKKRLREAISFRANEPHLRRAAIFYVGPKRIRNTAFLSHDQLDRADDRWLYLPAAKKVRRIPSSDRGDYFLGTDFTYEDINSQLKFDLSDYHFSLLAAEQKSGKAIQRLQALPISDQVAAELGYGGLIAEVDTQTWIPIKIVFFDPKQRKLKTIKVSNIQRIDGIATPLKIEAENHQTGHQTLFTYDQVTYQDEIDAQLYEPSNLSRGVPR